jgi:hypothetical protein
MFEAAGALAEQVLAAFVAISIAFIVLIGLLGTRPLR